MIIQILGNAIFILLLYLWHKYRLNTALREIENWAKDKNYEILNAKFKFFKKGPFFDGTLSTLVFIVQLTDSDDVEKECWIRVGSRNWGMLFNKEVHVKWDW